MVTLSKEEYAIKVELAKLGEQLAKNRGLLKSLEATLADRIEEIETKAKNQAKSTIEHCEKLKEEALIGLEEIENRRAIALASLEPEKQAIENSKNELKIELEKVKQHGELILNKENELLLREKEIKKIERLIKHKITKNDEMFNKLKQKLENIEKKDSQLSEKEMSIIQYEQNKCSELESLTNKIKDKRNAVELSLKSLSEKESSLKDEEKRIISERAKLRDALKIIKHK